MPCDSRMLVMPCAGLHALWRHVLEQTSAYKQTAELFRGSFYLGIWSDMCLRMKQCVRSPQALPR